MFCTLARVRVLKLEPHTHAARQALYSTARRPQKRFSPMHPELHPPLLPAQASRLRPPFLLLLLLLFRRLGVVVLLFDNKDRSA